jgi:two-component system, NtrC family, sensor kinase
VDILVTRAARGKAPAPERLELERLLERYRQVVETTRDAIVITDGARDVLFANSAAHALFGAPPGGLVGRSVERLVPPESREEIARRHGRAWAGAPQRYETEVISGTGERRVVSIRTAPLGESGVTTGVVAGLRDVTAERRARDAMAESEARYERLVETASDAIFTIDRAGRFTSVNKTVETAVGRPKEQVIGLSFRDVLFPETVAVGERLFASMLEGKRGRAELTYAMPGGEQRVGSITTTPILENGEVMGCVGIMRDITEERRLTGHLLEREKLAAIGQLVSGVAHELNNPLAGIMAFAQILNVGAGASAEQRDAAETIQREAKRAAKIVSNLLFFARQRDPERGVTDLNTVMRETLEMRRYALRTQQVEVVTEFDPSLPATWADAFQLQQVMLNLLTNAEQALRGRAGPRRITLATRRAGERVEMSVGDNGTGIAAEHLYQLFNPFFTTKPVGEGTGLGLSISDGIVRQHGGEIRVSSEPGVGATSTVSLPFAQPPLGPARAEPHHPLPESPPRAFLIVDDEASIRTALAIYLRRLGHAVEVAESGASALTLLGRARYDAIFLDLRMPDLGGDGVYAALRASDAEHASRVIFATGDVDADNAREFMRAAGRPFIAKPFALNAVAALLERVARDGGARSVVSDEHHPPLGSQPR